MIERRLYRAEGFGLAAKLRAVSWLYVTLLTLLALVGYVALYSAGGGPAPFANRHALRFAAGLVILIATALTDLRLIRRLAWPLYGLGIALLLAVARFGHVGKGAQRWIEIGAFQLQPSELMKIFLVLALAAWFRRASWERVGNPLFLIPPALASAIPVVLILKQPNLGTAVITALVAGSVFFAAGVRWWKFALIALAIGLATPLAYHHLHDYQRARIETFLHPESDPLGTGYNIIQSKIALGSGGLWGKGFLHGTQSHYRFLPQQSTDFIFSIFSEEWGFVGALLLFTLFLIIFVRGLRIISASNDPFAIYIGSGIVGMLFFHLIVNVGMAVGIMPITGIPLMLVSYGGSSLWTALLGIGLLMNIHYRRYL